MRNTIETIGVIAVISILGMAPAAAADAPCPAYGAQAGWSGVDQAVGDHRFVVFGEASHGLTAVHCLVGEVFRHLAEEKGFRVFVFESAWGVEDALAGFLHSDRTEVSSEESFFLNAFNSKPTRDLLIYIREFNHKHPRDPIRIAGYQPEQPVTDTRQILAHGERSPEFAAAGLKEKLADCKASTPEITTNI